MSTENTKDDRQPEGLGAMTGSALAEQRNALAEARLRIIARIKDNKRWGDPLDQEAGLQEARRIIGAMWDELPVPTPQAVIDHEAHISVHRLVRFRLLDLFCCEGGAGMGYHRAGFDITGVDIEPRKLNPHPVIEADAVEYVLAHGHEYDAIHASPPCQSYSRSFKHMATPQPMLIDAIRAALKKVGKPYVIENVVGAPLANASDLFGNHGVELCGTMFGLEVYRHRLFETSFPIHAPRPCNHERHGMNPHNVAGRKRIYERHGAGCPEKKWAKAMGVEWMSRDGAREAVPPIFTEYIGREMMRLCQTND